MQTKMYSRKLRQFKFRLKQLNKLVDTGAFDQLAYDKKQELLGKIRQLYRALASFFGTKKMRPILAGALVAMSLAATPVQAQQFAAGTLNPYGLLPAGELFNFMASADMDNDGDLDVLVSALPYSIYPATFYYFENEGSATNPAFAEPVENPFGLLPAFSDISISLGDLDGDGDIDLISGAGYTASIQFYENTGTPEAPAFGSAVANPFGLQSLFYYSFPVFADIDGDGDLDIFASDYFSELKFFENSGTPTAPAFENPISSPFGLEQGEGLLVAAFGDIDNDGDLDLLHADYNYGGVFLVYQENSGTPFEPAFETSQQNPFSLSVGYYLPFPDMMDMDGDGDLDILAGTNYYGNFAYFENIGTWAQAANSQITMEEDSEYAFGQADFNFDGSTGDFLGAVQIQSLPTVGTLNFQDVPVGLYQQINPDELGGLTFTPLPGEFGDPYDSFTFKVINQDGVYNVGNYTMTIVVSEVSAVSEPLAGVKVMLFPNPVGSELQVDMEFDQTPTMVRIELHDLLGRSILVKELSGSQRFQESLSLNGLSAGTYFVRLIADGQSATYAINKQ